MTDYSQLGTMARQSSIDAHGEAVHPMIAWQFMRDNPECFVDVDNESEAESFSATLAEFPPLEWVLAYLNDYGVGSK